MKHKTAVVILNWNNYEDLKKCIISLIDTGLNLALFIVDNGSTNDSTNRLKLEYPNFIYIESKSNLGFSRGVNLAIKEALRQSYEYIFLLNNDAFVQRDTIEVLSDILSSNSSYGIAGPRIFYAHQPEKIWSGACYFNKWKLNFEVPEKNHIINSSYQKIIQEVDAITGCAMMIKRSVFERIGYFDTDYFFYAEDADFCYRARKAGFKIIYNPNANVWHNIKEIHSSRTSKFVLFNRGKSYFLFIRKNLQFPWILHSVFLFVFIYTPFRIFQILKGRNNLTNIFDWLRGGIAGLTMKLKNEERKNINRINQVPISSD